MSSGVRSCPREINVHTWKSGILCSITNFKREVPTIEEYVPQVGDLQLLCQQDWFDPPLANDREERNRCILLVIKVKTLWDTIYDALWAMEKREPSLEIRHLLRNKTMYPYAADPSYAVFDQRNWGAVVSEWRGLMENWGTAIFGTPPESRRLTRETALCKYQTGVLIDACRAHEQILQESQETINTLLQIQASLQQLECQQMEVISHVHQIAGQVSLAAAAQTVSVEFFTTLEKQLRLYTEKPQEQIDEMLLFEQQMKELGDEVAALLAKEQQLDHLDQELEEQRLQVANETQQALANQLTTARAMEERVGATASQTSQQSQEVPNERTVIVVTS